MRSIVLAPLALSCGMAAAQAQTIYRCGDSYSQQPCPGGRAIGGEPAPAPTAQERKQAAATAQRDAKLAEQLERDRLKEEARPAQLYIPPPPRLEPELDPYRPPEKKATRKLDVFTASAPGSKPAGKDAGKKKAGQSGNDKDAAKASPAGKPVTGVLVTPR